MKSKHWDMKSPVIYKDTLGIPYSLEEVVVKMIYNSFFSEFFGPITNDLVKDWQIKEDSKQLRTVKITTSLRIISSFVTDTAIYIPVT